MSNEVKKSIYTNTLITRLQQGYINTKNERDIRVLSLTFRNGYPRFMIRLSQNETEEFWDNNINIPMDSLMLQLIGKTIIEAANGEITERVIQCKNLDYNNSDSDQRSIIIIGIIKIKRGEKNVIIEIKVPDRDVLSFDIVIDAKWFDVLENGSDITNSSKTNFEYAKIYGDTLANLGTAYSMAYAMDYATSVKEMKQ